ncbi:MAG TPA: DUF2382 domain-containing protein [Thermomicrobiales bacterium]|nr:DUF2382 domain-containing protein [Thermomicrobiales bacterium]
MSAAVRIIPEGADVYTVDEQKVGQACEHEAEYLHVQRGRLFGTDDYYFPANTIARVDEAAQRVELALTKDQVDAHDWTVPPPPATVPERPVAGAASPVDAASATVPGQAALNDRDEIVVPITEERLEVGTRPVELGEIVIHKRVIVERRMVPVELRREAVYVERAGQASATPEDWVPRAGERVIHEEAIRFPLRGEEPVLQTHPVVAEEVVVTREAMTERRTVSGEVRREEVRVDRTDARGSGTAVDAAATTAAAGATAARDVAATPPGLPAATLRPDMAVIGSDGRPVGRVKEVRGDDFLVDRPRQRDVSIPRSAVRDLTVGEVMLAVPADQVDDMAGTSPPLT